MTKNRGEDGLGEMIIHDILLAEFIILEETGTRNELVKQFVEQKLVYRQTFLPRFCVINRSGGVMYHQPLACVVVSVCQV